MHVIYAPKDPARGDRQEWVFDPDSVYADEAELIENHYGDTWRKFCLDVKRGKVGTYKLLIWHCMRMAAGNSAVNINLADVPRFQVGDVKVLDSSVEIATMRAEMERSSVLTGEERRMALAAADDEYAQAIERERAAEAGLARGAGIAWPGTDTSVVLGGNGAGVLVDRSIEVAEPRDPFAGDENYRPRTVEPAPEQVSTTRRGRSKAAEARDAAADPLSEPSGTSGDVTG